MARLIRPGSEGPARYLTVAEYNAPGQPYTPALTGFTATGITAYYNFLTAKMLHVGFDATVTGVSGNMIVSLPFQAVRAAGFYGNAVASDAGIGNYVGLSLMASLTTMWAIPTPSSGGVWNATTPFTWVNGDRLSMNLVYERA